MHTSSYGVACPLLAMAAMVGCLRTDFPTACDQDEAQCDDNVQDSSSSETSDDSEVGDGTAEAGCAALGPASEACGNCGQRTRECIDGTYGPWSACSGEGVCKPGESRPASLGCALPEETRFETCSSSCSWTAGACKRTTGWRTMGAAPAGFSSERTYFGSVWTGRYFIAYGGMDNSGKDRSDVARYDAATDSWSAVAAPPSAMPTGGSPGVWTGTQAIFWGGNTQPSATGAAYDPVSDTWEVLPTAPLAARMRHAMVWSTTTKELIVFAGDDVGSAFADGATFKPETKTWTKLPALPSMTGYWFPGGRFFGAWRGTEAVLAGEGSSGLFYFIYEPTARSWTVRDMPDLPSEYKNGNLVISAGEFTYQLVSRASSARYRELGGWYVGAGWTTGAEQYPAVWASSDSLYVWSGSTAGKPIGGGAVLNSGKWVPLDSTGEPAPRANAASIWTGNAAIVFGGDVAGVSGGIYVPGP